MNWLNKFLSVHGWFLKPNSPLKGEHSKAVCVYTADLNILTYCQACSCVSGEGQRKLQLLLTGYFVLK